MIPGSLAGVGFNGGAGQKPGGKSREASEPDIALGRPGDCFVTGSRGTQLGGVLPGVNPGGMSMATGGVFDT
jgi:hypothetical protein